MALLKHEELEYFSFQSFPKNIVFQAVFTRKGGVSPSPWDSLNLGGTVGDNRENVIENRRKIFDVINRPVDTIFDVWQVHGTNVICTDIPRPLYEPHEKADAIITNRPGITLMMRFADCVPIFVYDPKHKVVGMIHAGWRGTLNRIAEKVIHTLIVKYNSIPQELITGIGPSIGPDHYSIGRDVVSRVNETFKLRIDEVVNMHNGKTYFDLWNANRIILEECRVTNIEIAGQCTACDLSRWYSHRGEQGKTGRFGAVLGLI
jgi:polyphenol oxidase